MTVPLPFTPKPLPPSYTSIIDLAIPDGPATREESCNPFCSKLGGQAALLHALPSSLECPLCSVEMFLVLQMDCPREEWPGVDRVAYVFGCNRRTCSQQPEGWKVFFQCRLTASDQQIEVQRKDSSFWDSLMSDTDVTKPIQSLTSSKTQSTNKTTTASITAPTKNSFPPIFLHIEEELIVEKKSSAKSVPIHESAGNEEEWSGEQYEKFTVPGADSSFTRFQKRVAHYPRQCARFTVAATSQASSSDKLAPMQPVTALPFRDCDWTGELGRLPACS